MADFFWDIEITKNPIAIDPLDPWDAWPFGISVAALKGEGGVEIIDGIRMGEPRVHYDLVPAEQKAVSAYHVERFMADLLDLIRKGHRLITWNGTGFDWRLLGVLTDQVKVATWAAMNSYDPMFQVMCQEGYPLGLNNVALAFGHEGKPIDGASAPVLWDVGQYQEVIDYATHDVEMLERVVRSIEERGGIKWRNKDGELRFTSLMPRKLMRVKECLRLQLPDLSWQKDGVEKKNFTRKDFTGWMISA